MRHFVRVEAGLNLTHQRGDVGAREPRKVQTKHRIPSAYIGDQGGRDVDIAGANHPEDRHARRPLGSGQVANRRQRRVVGPLQVVHDEGQTIALLGQSVQRLGDSIEEQSLCPGSLDRMEELATGLAQVGQEPRELPASAARQHAAAHLGPKAGESGSQRGDDGSVAGTGIARGNAVQHEVIEGGGFGRESGDQPRLPGARLARDDHQTRSIRIGHDSEEPCHRLLPTHPRTLLEHRQFGVEEDLVRVAGTVPFDLDRLTGLVETLELQLVHRSERVVGPRGHDVEQGPRREDRAVGGGVTQTTGVEERPTPEIHPIVVHLTDGDADA